MSSLADDILSARIDADDPEAIAARLLGWAVAARAMEKQLDRLVRDNFRDLAGRQAALEAAQRGPDA